MIAIWATEQNSGDRRWHGIIMREGHDREQGWLDSFGARKGSFAYELTTPAGRGV
jgi:hypothetical protein